MKKMKGNRFLSLVLTLCFMFTMVPVTAMADEKPALPTATVTEIENEDLTFAMNFVADNPTEEQLAYYGDWYADFVLTVNKAVTFNANGGADGYLSGQYDEWSENWVNVPLDDVTLSANTPLKIMEYAASMLGQSGLKLTYNDVCSFVKDFNCGVFFEEDFLAENPDLEVTLELRMYNNEDESESYAIGDTYIFEVEVPELPTATVTEIENEDLTFAMNFIADDVTEEQLAYYGDWYADFELTVNKEVTFNANGGADGYLSGQYDEWSENWVNVPLDDVTLSANTPLKIMEYAASMLGQPGLKLTYNDVYTAVKDFDCGVFFEEAFLAANPDLEVTLELRMYNPANESESYVIGEIYEFTTVPEVPETVTVTFDSKNGSAITSVEVEVGSTVAKPSNPTRSGYRFDGWYTEDGDEYDFATPVTEAMELHAEWTKIRNNSSNSSNSSSKTETEVKHPVDVEEKGDSNVSTNKDKAAEGEKVVITVTPEEGKEVESIVITDEEGNVLEVTEVGENEYSFVMPEGEVDINVTTDTAYDQEIVLEIGNNTYSDNDVEKHTDVAPVIVGDRTLVPLRIVIEALGGDVVWNEDTRTVVMVIDGKPLTLTIDQLIPGFGTGAIIMNDRTMVPIRYVSEYVGANVEWNAETGQVIIEK